MLKSIAVRLMLVMALCTVCLSCQDKNVKEGKLFILGGGNLSSSIIGKIIAESGLDKGDTDVILPMSSEEPDTAVYYTTAYFTSQGLSNVYGLHFVKGKPYSQARIDLSVMQAWSLYRGAIRAGLWMQLKVLPSRRLFMKHITKEMWYAGLAQGQP